MVAAQLHNDIFKKAQMDLYKSFFFQLKGCFYFPPQLVSVASVVIMYVMEIGCLLLSVLGIFGACKGKRWCLILVTMLGICVLQVFF